MTFQTGHWKKGMRHWARVWLFFAVLGGFGAVLLLLVGWAPENPLAKYVLTVGALLVTFSFCILLANGLIKLEQLDGELFKRRKSREPMDND